MTTDTTTRERRSKGASALYGVMVAVRRLFHRLGAAADALHADLGVTASQHAVLEALADDGAQTVPQIARRKGVTRQHIQVLVNSLLSAGLVQAIENPGHRRSVLIGLTAEGARRFGVMRERERGLLEELDAAFEVRRLTQATETLRRLAAEIEAFMAGGVRGSRPPGSRRLPR
ncbi:MAG: MarR family transcriptional regulator [Candidatus Lambdaproteobacteria bacterium]|nr:MarR family transcriptional regulator [Candidatus Lambdaproteobacteria bacterium]